MLSHIQPRTRLVSAYVCVVEVRLHLNESHDLKGKRIAVVLLLLYGFVVWMDSASLTAGAAGTAEPSRRGATLAVHPTQLYEAAFHLALATLLVVFQQSRLFPGQLIKLYILAYLGYRFLTRIDPEIGPDATLDLVSAAVAANRADRRRCENIPETVLP